MSVITEYEDIVGDAEHTPDIAVRKGLIDDVDDWPESFEILDYRTGSVEGYRWRLTVDAATNNYPPDGFPRDFYVFILRIYEVEQKRTFWFDKVENIDEMGMVATPGEFYDRLDLMERLGEYIVEGLSSGDLILDE